jgi:26S proteasome regulatory subunit T6
VFPFIHAHFHLVRMLREELQLLQEQGSYVGEVVKAMDKKKVLVKVHPEGKFVVDIDKNIDINDIKPNCRVALRNDSYTLHKILPSKVSANMRQSNVLLNIHDVL